MESLVYLEFSWDVGVCFHECLEVAPCYDQLLFLRMEEQPRDSPRLFSCFFITPFTFLYFFPVHEKPFYLLCQMCFAKQCRHSNSQQKNSDVDILKERWGVQYTDALSRPSCFYMAC